MTDYRRYCSIAGITNKEMIDCLAAKFPKYSKAVQSMVCDPAGYAVQLIPDAEDALLDAFGYAPGLSCERRTSRRSHGNKAKPNRLYVRLDDSLMERVKSTADRMHFAFMQDLIEAALVQFVDRYESYSPPCLKGGGPQGRGDSV